MLTYSILYPHTTATRCAVSMDGMWKIQFDAKSIGRRENWRNGLPDPDWMPVPACLQAGLIICNNSPQRAILSLTKGFICPLTS